MKSGKKKKLLTRLSTLLRWGKITAKFAAIGTTITGVVAAFTSSSSATGITIGAAGATTYAATKDLTSSGYEKTKHVAPGPAIRGSLAARAIMEAGMRKPEKGEAFVEEPVMKFKTFMDAKPEKKHEPENPFSWTQDMPPPAPPADPAQGSFAFLNPPPVMVVTTEEEEERDETGKNVKKIRRTQLNFVAQDKGPGEQPDKSG
jgi:hypothetical protein